MGPDEAESMSSLLHDVVAETGLTAVVVEHNLGVLRALADRLVALDFGRVVAVGEASEVLGDGRVASSYLGSDR